MAQLKALVIDGVRAVRLRTDHLPKYVTSPRAGWEAYLAYCRQTMGEEGLHRRLDDLNNEIEGGLESIRELMDDLKANQTALNTARADKKRYERLIKEDAGVDPADLAYYAQEFDMISNLEGVARIGVDKMGQFFVVFKPRRKLANGKWCDFGDWQVHPTITGYYAGYPIRLRRGATRESHWYSYPHYLGQFCWGEANQLMRSYVQKGLYFELLSHASVALATFKEDEESCAPHFRRLRSDDRSRKVAIDPAAKQLYIDAKARTGSDYATALQIACDTIQMCQEEIEYISGELKAERERLPQLRKEAAEVKDKLAVKAAPEATWRQEFDEVLALLEVLAVKVYEYGGRQCLKFVVRLTHQTPEAIYYLGDYEVDFLLYDHGHRLRVERLKTGLNPRTERGDFGDIYHGRELVNVNMEDILRFDADKGEMLGKLRAIIQRLSVPDADHHNGGVAKFYYVLWEADKK